MWYFAIGTMRVVKPQNHRIPKHSTEMKYRDVMLCALRHQTITKWMRDRKCNIDFFQHTFFISKLKLKPHFIWYLVRIKTISVLEPSSVYRVPGKLRGYWTFPYQPLRSISFTNHLNLNFKTNSVYFIFSVCNSVWLQNSRNCLCKFN